MIHSSNAVRRSGILWLVGGFVLGAVGAHGYYRATLPEPLPDRTASNRYFFTEFEPRFRREECLVRMDVSYLRKAPRDIGAVIFDDTSRFLFEKEPKAAIFDFGGKQNSIYLQFADECDRRFEIAERMAAYIQARHPDLVELKASRDLVLPGAETIDSTSVLHLSE